jgi:hypothetical protein
MGTFWRQRDFRGALAYHSRIRAGLSGVAAAFHRVPGSVDLGCNVELLWMLVRRRRLAASWRVLAAWSLACLPAALLVQPLF